MKILVCGGRNLRDERLVFQTLDDLRGQRPITCVVTGAASGADYLAEKWAKKREIAYRGHPAPWHSHDVLWCRCDLRGLGGIYPNTCKAAGMWRNGEMLRREHAPRPDPSCEYCHGTGEYFGHASRCESDLCALAGGYDDCHGVITECGCCDPRAPRIGLVVAFPGGSGTAHMVRLARDAGIDVQEVSG